MMEHWSLRYIISLFLNFFKTSHQVLQNAKIPGLKDTLVRAKYHLKAVMRRDHNSHQLGVRAGLFYLYFQAGRLLKEGPCWSITTDKSLIYQELP